MRNRPRRLVLIQGDMVALYIERKQVAVYEVYWPGSDACALVEEVRTSEVEE